MALRQRVQYRKADERGRLKFVIVDFDEAGGEWADQYCGEVTWHVYQPSPEERLAAIRLRDVDDAVNVTASNWPTLPPDGNTQNRGSR